MSNEEQHDSASNSDEVWRDVGEQFRVLGKSLASAVQTAWDDEDNQRRVEQLRGGLDSMFAELNGAIKSTADSPEAQHFRAEAKESFRNLRDTGEKAAVELRPHVVKVLQQINQEIEKAIDRMDSAEDTYEPEADSEE
jgi:hypothetical protein